MKNLLIVFCLALGIVSCKKDKIIVEPEQLPKTVNIAKGDTFISDLNKPPVATAGADKTVNEGDSIAFSDATAVDPEGDSITSYYWVCVDIRKARFQGDYVPSRYFFLAEDTVSGVFSDPKVLHPTFTAPNVNDDQQYICILILTGTHIFGEWKKTDYSDNPQSDFLTVTVKDSK